MWQTFGYGATVTDVKIVREKMTGKLSGYGFVEFPSTYEAEQVLVCRLSSQNHASDCGSAARSL
jgi:hypothetical protein